MIRKTALTGLCLIVSANAASAVCAGPQEVAALKIASLQQRLMVAGLACQADAAYNRFVLAHRAELQRSDDDLKAYFIRNGGEDGYDAYKTKLANLAAHGPATDRNAFCAATESDFRALAQSGDLQDVAAREMLLVGEACAAPVMAAASPATPPVRIARNEDVVVPVPREIPVMPYAEAPPPLPQRAAAARQVDDGAPQAVAAGRDDYADTPPRPATPRDNARYWYYRRLYAQPYSYDGARN